MFFLESDFSGTIVCLFFNSPNDIFVQCKTHFVMFFFFLPRYHGTNPKLELKPRFPGHMTKALKTVNSLCHSVDIMIEVRDARVCNCFLSVT